VKSNSSRPSRPLRLTVDQFALAQQALGIVTWVWDPATNETRWFGDLTRLVGVAPEQFDGSFGNYLRFVHPDDRAGARALYIECLKGVRREYRNEERIVHADGSLRWLEIYGRGEYAADGRCVRMMGLVRDATERLETERRLVDAEAQHAAQLRELNQSLEQRVRERTLELQAANRELESFSYSVSHDLRAPLRAVAGFAGLLRERHADELSAEGRRLLARVEASAAHMGKLINSLLELARAGQRPLQREAVDMAALAAEVAREAVEQAGRPAALVLAGAPVARADRVLIRQAWVNLIDNAIKYSRGTPQARIEIGGVRNAGHLEYHVRDNGAGFDPRYASRLFGVFQRLHPESEFEGTGVGLALVARIVHRHGGEVFAEGAPGQGATFRFTLPL
jgi:PAS domain S-box-containing protein